jgi:CheY-like chemotaxis protein
MRRVLVADDSSTIRKVVQLALSGADLDVVAVENGPRLLAELARSSADLVLCDVLMPEMSGYEVVERLKADPATRSIPVLLLTGAYEPFDEERAARIGAAGFLAKPFESRVLVSRVEEMLAPQHEPTAAAAQVAAVGRAEPEPIEDLPASPQPPISDPVPVTPAWNSGRVPLPGDPDFSLNLPAAAVGSGLPPAGSISGVGDELMRLEVRRVLESVAPEVVREVAWEVIPDLLERLLRETVPSPPAHSKTPGDDRS